MKTKLNPSFWQYLIPQHLLSRLFGKLAYCEWPWFKNWAIQHFLKKYPVNLSEAIITNPKEFGHFNDFFTRALKPELRPLEKKPHAFVSPVDGTLSAHGNIEKGQLFQAKNHTYSLEALLGGADDKLLSAFEKGLYGTFYLAPHDYHRIHMPLDGTLVALRYVPGRLFSVNQKTADTLPGLFAKNERVVLFFNTEYGPMVLVLVGAMIVASISTPFAGLVAPQGKKILHQNYPHNAESYLHFKKGDEIGRFHLGSTVIALVGNPDATWDLNLHEGLGVRFGQKLTTIPQNNELANLDGMFD